MRLAFLAFAISTTIGGAKEFFAKPEQTNTVNPKSSTANSINPAADLVLTNGKIYTLDSSHPWATALAGRGETIVAVADSEAEIKGWIGPKTRILDLQGKFAMPGFNDAHVHLASAGQAKLEVNLEGVPSLAEMQKRIRARLKDFQPGEWITGRGWDHTLWPDKTFPTRQELDAVSTDHPMFFYRVDGHVAIVNSRALAIAGITRATPDPPGGRILRDPQTGDPTGLLEEDAGMNLVFNRIPSISPVQRRRALELALDEAAQFGVTSVQDYSVRDAPDGDNFGWDNFLVLQKMRAEGKLKVRVSEWLPFELSPARLQEMRRIGGTRDPWIKTGAVKAFLDGSLGSRTAAMLAPYSDEPDTSGILRMDPAALREKAIELDRAGVQLAFHAIGDRANRVALDTFAAVAASNGPRDRRDRIEHAQIVAVEDLPRFASLGVIASIQPSHLLDDARWADGRLGLERVKGAYAWNTLERSGAHLAFGTDYPVESVNPLRGIYACVARQTPEGDPPGGWRPQERLSVEDCLRNYTVGSAYAEFEEQQKGTIAPGKLADIVIFSADITRIPAHELLTTSVETTIAGGRNVYQRQ
ncbi:MAG TPA: amidohydrolase [Candidatus Limnocylindrales bacterium]|nr:amidohydrolase [Candidatus Limnocylindrales bacterium]